LTEWTPHGRDTPLGDMFMCIQLNWEQGISEIVVDNQCEDIDRSKIVNIIAGSNDNKRNRILQPCSPPLE